MRNRILLLLAVLGCWGVLGYAETIYIIRGTDGDNKIQLSEENLFDRVAPQLVIECQVGSLESNEVQTVAGTFATLSLPGFHSTKEVGAPHLPMINRLLEIPLEAQVAVRVLESEVEEYALADLGIRHALMPCQPSRRKDGEEVEFAFDRGLYQVDTYGEREMARIEDLGMLRSTRLALLTVAPVAYNPAQERLRVHKRLRLEISLAGANEARTRAIQQQYVSPYFAWVSDQVLVPNALHNLRKDLTRHPISYVIVSDRRFASALQPLVEWKTAKGFKVTVAFTDAIGNTTEAIKNYLANLYNSGNETEPAPSFVLFVGDMEQIPTFRGKTAAHSTDLYYTTITPDNMPDIYYGRFSAQTVDQLLPQIEKTLQYEKGEFPDPSFLQNVVMIAGWDSSHAVEWGWPQIKYGIKYYYNKTWGIEVAHQYLSASSQQNAAQIRERVSAGAAFVNYTAHGDNTSWADPSFRISNINSLLNKDRYPLVVGNCCLTNKFDVSECFGEAWLRAKDRGAIGYIGGSNYTYWDEDLWWGVGNYPIQHPNSEGNAPPREQTGMGAYDAAFEKGYFSNDAMIYAGNLAVQEANSSRTLYYWEVYHLMGDPSLMVYWGLPKKLEAKHASMIPVGATRFTVETEPGAYVGLSAAGVYHGAALADASGKADVTLTPFVTDAQATVVVTRKNRLPYQATVEVKNP